MLEDTYLDKVISLAQLISGDKSELGDEIRYFAAYPAAFRNSHFAEHAAIGPDSYPDPEDLPAYPEHLLHTFLWNIMYGILRSRQHLIKLDGDASGETARWAIATLLQRWGQTGIDLAPIAGEAALPSREILRQTANILEKQGLTLARIDDGSDSGPLLVVPDTDLLQLLTLGNELGLEIWTDFD